MVKWVLWRGVCLLVLGIGSRTEVAQAFDLAEIRLQDTYYDINIFQYDKAPGMLLGHFAGVYR